MISQQILAWKTNGHGKPFRALAHQHHMPGLLHHSFRNQRNILDISHPADRPRPPRRPVHAASIEFDHAFLVGDSPKPDAGVIRIVLRPLHHAQRRVQRVSTAGEECVCVVEIVESVVCTNNDRTSNDRTLATGRAWLRICRVLHATRNARQPHR